MRLISLNAWGGRQEQQYFDFLNQEKQNTDIFCFQEMLSSPTVQVVESLSIVNLFERTSTELSDFQANFFKSIEGFDYGNKEVDFDLKSGNAIFSKGLQQKDFSGEKLPKWKPQEHRSGVWAYAVYEKFSVICVHGLSVGGTKEDNEFRIDQSNKILNLAERLPGEKIIIGDLNLNLNTESIKILEQKYTNLISNFKIQTTRSYLYKRKDEMPLADYCFVSAGIKVKDFSVLNLLVSDHLPLVLDFEV